MHEQSLFSVTEQLPQDTSPSSYFEFLKAGYILLEHKEYQEAAKVFKRALILDAFSGPAIAGLYISLINSQQKDEAYRLSQVCETMDSDPYTLYVRAEALYAQEKYEESLPYFYEFLTCADPTFEFMFDAYKNIGNILVRLRDFEGAEEFYNKAYAINRSSDTLFVNFGTLEIQKANFELAAERFRSALLINASNDKAWTGLALIHDLKSDRKLAIASVEKALDCNPANKTALQIFINWSEELQNRSQMQFRLEKYLNHHADDIDMSLVHAEVLISLNEFDAAQLEVIKVLSYDSNEVRALSLSEKIKGLGR